MRLRHRKEIGPEDQSQSGDDDEIDAKRHQHLIEIGRAVEMNEDRALERRSQCGDERHRACEGRQIGQA